ncbi:Branched-chain-amino-acid aminotransferase 2, chloroplastic [Linum perenne]
MIPSKASSFRSLVQSLRSITSLPKVGNEGRCSYSSSVASSLQQVVKPSTYRSSSEDDYADVDWDNLGFGITPADYMYINKCKIDGEFREGQVTRYGALELSPSAGVLNYGQGLYEGTKAYRKEDGRLLVFRPDQNALRMKMGADRICMPCPTVDQFVDAVKQVALANKRWTPPPGKGTMYIRPLLMGSGPILGLAPAPEYTFLIYCSPVANYFKVLKAMAKAKQNGYSDVLYLDSVHKRYLEEVSSCNVFIVKGRVISTPAAVGTILQGVTRKSIIEIAIDHGYQVEERAVAVEELEEAEEVFCTGTAVGVASVGSITYKGKRMKYKVGGETVAKELYTILEGIKSGDIVDKKGWVVEIQ